jgi:hypothetical protein
MPRLRVLGLLLLSACRIAMPEGWCDPSKDWCNDTGAGEDTGAGRIDADGDGSYADAGDCDDTDANVFPGSPEVCDGLDNNCDGSIDEGLATTVYADRDGDLFGDPESSEEVCEIPAGYVQNATDCDDSDGTVNPAMDELCDDQDNDCDGVVDENAGVLAYVDADDDGFGAGEGTLVCEIERGYSDTGGDCDDLDSDIDPDEEERCDGVDNNCDGAIDEGFDADGDGTADCDDAEECDGIDNDGDGDIDEDAVDATTWYIDYDGDGYGSARFTETACEAPPSYIDNSDDCDDEDDAVNPGAAEVCDGADNNCDGAVDEGYDADGDTLADCFDSEECDGLDNDGDGEVDEGAVDASVWYVDGDGDGYGDALYSSPACDAPLGYVADASDCDDADAAVNPGASEACNGADDDCDGSVPADEVDADGDGLLDCLAPP